MAVLLKHSCQKAYLYDPDTLMTRRNKMFAAKLSFKLSSVHGESSFWKFARRFWKFFVETPEKHPTKSKNRGKNIKPSKKVLKKFCLKFFAQNPKKLRGNWKFSGKKLFYWNSFSGHCFDNTAEKKFQNVKKKLAPSPKVAKKNHFSRKIICSQNVPLDTQVAVLITLPKFFRYLAGKVMPKEGEWIEKLELSKKLFFLKIFPEDQ